LLIHSFLLNTGNNIGTEAAIKLSEALKSNSSLTRLNLWSNKLVSSVHSFSLNTGTNIGEEGAIKLSEALKANSSLTSLNLGGNGLVDRFMLTQYR
jgi:Ran GTPase-activating protein (RanGAP) involved in mRNA processing and transport